ncbi:MAG: response regulator [bacterium]
MKILMIDDELNLINLFKIMFERNGHIADTVNNLEEAKNLIDNNYDYILVDFYMNNENTLDFVKYLLTKYNKNQVCMLTGTEDKKDYKKMDKIGVVKYLKKPITYNEIIEKLSEKK